MVLLQKMRTMLSSMAGGALVTIVVTITIIIFKRCKV
jgi:hypothetical protein